MRTPILVVSVLLLAAALVLTLWPRISAVSAAPPGQYPIDLPTFQWPRGERTSPYHPVRGMGSNEVAFTDGPPAKLSCALE
jgi:hypothetical protein